MPERPSYRLPRTALPRRYDLEIRPDLGNASFEGTASITVDLVERATETVLNAVDLVLSDPVLTGPGGRLVGAVRYAPEVEQAVLTWPEAIEPGRWTLSMRFRGTLGDTLRGFYLTSVTDADGTATAIACTQCEATDARRIFPCWDEPDLKAVFAITLVVDEGLAALSNGPETSSEAAGEGKRRVRFADTMAMSTYLVALVVGPLRLTEPLWAGDVPVRVAARPDRIHLAGTARQEAADLLLFFAAYFGLPYPAGKIDHVAIPDFEAGAMENLGCVTYREEALLLDPERASPMERMAVVETIAHETAHMWFGDLVTMRWWNGIWLNEAFATFMELVAVDALHPEWKVWTRFMASRGQAMTVDGLAATRPIEFPVGAPAEAEAMFDILTYAKGGAVLRMLEQHLGPEVFRQGIHLYLERHRHANTETADLWAALEAASGQPVRDVMDSWVLQGGYPLVRIERGPGPDEATLRQAPFSYRGEGRGSWQVPVALAVAAPDGGRERRHLLLGPDPLTVQVGAGAPLVLVNEGGWGFYRVAYDAPLWQAVIESWPHLTDIERYVIAEDVWAAVQCGEVALSQALALWRTFGSERDPDLWGAVARHLRLLDIMADEADRPALAAYTRRIARPAFDELTWQGAPGESVQRGRLRGRLMHLLATTGRDRALQQEAVRRFFAHVEGGPQIASDLLTETAHVVAAGADMAQWELLYRLFRTAATPQDEARYLYALADVQDPALVRRTLDLYFSAEVRSQDAPTAIAMALLNRHARAAAWEMVEARWDELLRRLEPAVVRHLAAPVPSIVEPALAARTAAWLRAHPVPQAKPQIDQALEFQAVHIAMAERIGKGLAAALLAGA